MIILTKIKAKQVLVIFSLLVVFTSLPNSFAFARGWSWGVGYHNPPNATIGLNFMHLWNQWAFEFGLGYINSTEKESSNSSSNSNDVNLSVAGDLNLKYLFGSGRFRPYVQGGTYAGVAAQTGNSSGANASLSSGFAGAGFFILGSSFDFYISYVTAGKGSLQLGFNF